MLSADSATDRVDRRRTKSLGMPLGRNPTCTIPATKPTSSRTRGKESFRTSPMHKPSSLHTTSNNTTHVKQLTVSYNQKMHRDVPKLIPFPLGQQTTCHSVETPTRAAPRTTSEVTSISNSSRPASKTASENPCSAYLALRCATWAATCTAATVVRAFALPPCLTKIREPRHKITVLLLLLVLPTQPTGHHGAAPVHPRTLRSQRT